MLTVIDECTRECLATSAGRHFRSDDVIQCLSELFVAKGVQSISDLITVRSSLLRRLV